MEKRGNERLDWGTLKPEVDHNTDMRTVHIPTQVHPGGSLLLFAYFSVVVFFLTIFLIYSLLLKKINTSLQNNMAVSHRGGKKRKKRTCVFFLLLINSSHHKIGKNILINSSFSFNIYIWIYIYIYFIYTHSLTHDTHARTHTRRKLCVLAITVRFARWSGWVISEPWQKNVKATSFRGLRRKAQERHQDLRVQLTRP